MKPFTLVVALGMMILGTGCQTIGLGGGSAGSGSSQALAVLHETDPPRVTEIQLAGFRLPKGNADMAAGSWRSSRTTPTFNRALGTSTGDYRVEKAGSAVTVKLSPENTILVDGGVTITGQDAGDGSGVRGYWYTTKGARQVRRGPAEIKP